MKVFDVFLFCYELDLLEIRLNLLDPYVDHFVISESKKTHSGIDKELYYCLLYTSPRPRDQRGSRMPSSA